MWGCGRGHRSAGAFQRYTLENANVSCPAISDPVRAGVYSSLSCTVVDVRNILVHSFEHFLVAVRNFVTFSSAAYVSFPTALLDPASGGRRSEGVAFTWPLRHMEAHRSEAHMHPPLPLQHTHNTQTHAQARGSPPLKSSVCRYAKPRVTEWASRQLLTQSLV